MHMTTSVVVSGNLGGALDDRHSDFEVRRTNL